MSRWVEAVLGIDFAGVVHREGWCWEMKERDREGEECSGEWEIRGARKVSKDGAGGRDGKEKNQTLREKEEVGQGKQGNARVRREDTEKEEREIKKKEVSDGRLAPLLPPPPKKRSKKKKSRNCGKQRSLREEWNGDWRWGLRNCTRSTQKSWDEKQLGGEMERPGKEKKGVWEISNREKDKWGHSGFKKLWTSS